MAITSAAGNKAVATAPTYCAASDVAEILQKPAPSAHAGEGEPSLAAWNNRILAAEDEIDTTCGTSWRPRREYLEYHDWETYADEEYWIQLKLNHAPVLTLSAADGDGLEVRQGGIWTNMLGGGYVQGPNGQFWVQEDSGVLRIRRSIFQLTDQARVRVNYRYGNSQVPQAIKEACALLVAARLSMGDLVATGGRGGEVDRIGLDPRIREWKREAYSILARYQRWS